MVTSRATTVQEYLAALPPDRREAVEAVRRVILENLPAGFEEGLDFGMIGYHVPLSRYPGTYNGHPLAVAALASQKGYMAVYLTSVYGDPALKSWFEAEYARRGKKLDMGKSCVRFKSLDDLPLDLLGETIARVDLDTFLARYEAARAAPRTRPAKATAKKAAAKKASTKKTAVKKAPAKKTATKKRQ
jgi:hypothetical protein